MQIVAISVEANLLAKRARVRNERRVTAKDETSPSNIKIDTLEKIMEILMDIIENMERKPQWDNQQASPVRNPNFRKNQNFGKMDRIRTLGLLSKKVMQRHPIRKIQNKIHKLT